MREAGWMGRAGARRGLAAVADLALLVLAACAGGGARLGLQGARGGPRLERARPQAAAAPRVARSAEPRSGEVDAAAEGATGVTLVLLFTEHGIGSSEVVTLLGKHPCAVELGEIFTAGVEMWREASGTNAFFNAEGGEGELYARATREAAANAAE